MIVGKNNIITKAKLSKERYLSSQVLEELKLKVLEVQSNKNKMATLEDVVDYLNNDNENNYIIKLSPEGEEIESSKDVLNAKEIFVIYKNYKFKIDNDLIVTFFKDSNNDEENNGNDTQTEYSYPDIINLKNITSNSCEIYIDTNLLPSKSPIARYEYFIDDIKYESAENIYLCKDLEKSRKYNIYAICYYESGESFETKTITLEINDTFEELTAAMNSNVSEFGSVFADNNEESAYKAFDRDASSYWNGGNVDSYIGYKFNEATECNAIKITQPYTKDVIKDFVIQYSDDGINYIDASPTLTFIIGNSSQIFELNKDLGKHLYWRYKNLTGYRYSNFCGISELEFLYLSETNSNQYIDLTYKTTDSNISEFGEVFADNNGTSAYYAFDKNTSSYWDGGNVDSYIGYKFNEPVECNVIRITQPFTKDVIKDFIIQYSDDGINYTDANTTLTFIRGNSSQEFELNKNLGKHLYWRYKNITGYRYSNFCAISELKFIYLLTNKIN